jgi:hypothetical protein
LQVAGLKLSTQHLLHSTLHLPPELIPQMFPTSFKKSCPPPSNK